jgi:hypothetical protein
MSCLVRFAAFAVAFSAAGRVAVAQAPAFLGDFTGTPNVLTYGVAQNATTIFVQANPQPGISDGAGEGSFPYVDAYAPFGTTFTELGNEVGFRINHTGGDLLLSLTGLTSDLDLLLIDSSGLTSQVINPGPGFGGTLSESIVESGLAAGTYYAVVDTFGAVNTGSNFTIQYTPEPATLVLLGLGGLAMARRRC